MQFAKLASLFGLFVGLSMISLWVMLVSTGQVPELTTEPYRIIAHIAAEVITALLLIIASAAIWKKKPWARGVFLFSSGALFYTLIASPGYYLQLGLAPMVLMFAVILLIDLIFFAKILRDDEAI